MPARPLCRLATLLFAISYIGLASVSAQSGQVVSTFPQIAIGGGWSSDLFVTNQDDTAALVDLSLFTGRGLNLQATTNLGTGSHFSFNLAAGRTQIVRITSSGDTTVGYAVLLVPAGVSVRASQVVRWESGNQVATQLGVSQQFPSTVYSFPAEIDPARSINTGIAFAIPASSLLVQQTQKVVVNLINQAGQSEGRVVVPLQPGEHLARFLNEDPLFPDLHSFSGTVVVSGANPFGLLALRLEDLALGSLNISTGPVVAPFLQTTSPTTEVEPNDMPQQGTVLTLPARATGTINPAGDADFYRFIGNQGDIVTILTCTRAFGSQADTVLTLFGPDGQGVSANDQNGMLSSNDSFLQAVLPTTGTYVLGVEDSSQNGGSQYGYDLHVSTFATSAPSTTPVITSLTPTSAGVGDTITLTITGSNLAGASAVQFSPSSSVTVTNVQASATQVTASVSSAMFAASGARQVSVTTPAGTSNTLPFSLTPHVSFVTPSGGRAGTTVSIDIAGGGLSGTTSVNFSPSTGITVSNISASSMDVTASVTIAADAAQGTRQLSVTTPGGTSNSVSFSIAGPTGGTAPTISNLVVGAPVYGSNQVSIPMSFDFTDPDGDIIYIQGNHTGSAKLVFAKQGCTSSSSASWLNRPGQISGSFSFSRVIMNSWLTGNFTIQFQLEDAAGNRSNALTFQIGVWSCELFLNASPDYQHGHGWDAEECARPFWGPSRGVERQT